MTTAPDGSSRYGDGDASYRAAGGVDGLTRLVDAFYDTMDALPDASRIRSMHPRDLAVSRRKLTAFLSGWLNGPKLFDQEFGTIIIPKAHAHMAIDEAERDAWMACMRAAVEAQPWSDDFKTYFIGAIAVPAERVRVASVERRRTRAGA